MKNRLGVGIVGLGNISGHHIQSINELDQYHLIAVTSRDEKKREDAEVKYGIRAFDALSKMLKLPELDAVIICSPSGYHLGQARQAAHAGKHVIVEKPLEINVERSREMIRICSESRVSLSCIFQNRYSDDYQKLYNAIQHGELGKLVLGNAYIKWHRDQAYYDLTDWRGTKALDGGAALINQSIHTIDLLLNLMGNAKAVCGQIRTLTHDIEGEDLGVGIVEFENGALGTIEGSTAMFEGFKEKLEIHGSEGSVILEGGKITHWNTRKSGNLPIQPQTARSGSSDPMGIGYELHKRQLKAIAEAILQGSQPPVNGKEACHPIQVIEAIYKSALKGEKIMLS